jgi:cytochrome o ubiquinol oxidase subunit 3
MSISETTSIGLTPESESVPMNHERIKTFGFWVYLMSDAILFSLLFATYSAMSRNYAGGPTGKDLFDLYRALAETLLLLFSSVAYGFAMVSLIRGKRGLILLWLSVTFMLGLGFVVMEVSEFLGMIAQGAGPDRSGFLSAFFTLVGTHGLHVSIGLIWIVVMAAQLVAKGLTSSVRSRLLRLGMFWHFLDIVWIGIFSVVYLLGVM